MVNVLRRPNPRLADVRCTRIKFEPGDRVLVKVYAKLDPDDERRIRRAVQRWAGCEVEVLIVNGLTTDVEIIKASGETIQR